MDLSLQAVRQGEAVAQPQHVGLLLKIEARLLQASGQIFDACTSCTCLSAKEAVMHDVAADNADVNWHLSGSALVTIQLFFLMM